MSYQINFCSIKLENSSTQFLQFPRAVRPFTGALGQWVTCVLVIGTALSEVYSNHQHRVPSPVPHGVLRHGRRADRRPATRTGIDGHAPGVCASFRALYFYTPDGLLLGVCWPAWYVRIRLPTRFVLAIGHDKMMCCRRALLLPKP